LLLYRHCRRFWWWSWCSKCQRILHLRTCAHTDHCCCCCVVVATGSDDGLVPSRSLPLLAHPAPAPCYLLITPGCCCCIVVAAGLMMAWCSLCSRMLRLQTCAHTDHCCCCFTAIAAGSDEGLVQFVPSAPLSRILAEHRTIHKYLAQTQADPQGESAQLLLLPRLHACLCATLAASGISEFCGVHFSSCIIWFCAHATVHVTATHQHNMRQRKQLQPLTFYTRWRKCDPIRAWILLQVRLGCGLRR
jgi:hypothetical protein